MSSTNPAAFDARIEALTQALERTSDADARRSARELVRLVLELHRDGLERMREIVRDGPDVLVRRLAQDPIVTGLFALHELGPVDASPHHTPRPATGRTALLQIIRPATMAAPPATPSHGVDRPHCDACGAPLGDVHHHAVDIVTRQLLCSCRACWLLSGAHAAPGSRRPVPDRYVAGPGFRVTAAQWDALEVPVDTAFFLHNSVGGRTIAFYPSPAGATESALSLTAWGAVADANPWVRAAASDVEAVLVRKSPVRAEFDAFIVPIDACYELAGRLRVHWHGVHGGAGAQVEVDRFFAEVAARSRQSPGQ